MLGVTPARQAPAAQGSLNEDASQAAFSVAHMGSSKAGQWVPHEEAGSPGPLNIYLRLVIPLTLFFCGPGPASGHETTLDLVSGANVVRFLHKFSTPTRWNGSPGQVRPKTIKKHQYKL